MPDGDYMLSFYEIIIRSSSQFLSASENHFINKELLNKFEITLHAGKSLKILFDTS